MIGWKQALTLDRRNVVIVKLYIPDNALIYEIKNIKTKKKFLTTDYAYVESLTSPDGKHSVSLATAFKDTATCYEVGEMVMMNFHPELGRNSGIYFFRTRKEALKYEY